MQEGPTAESASILPQWKNDPFNLLDLGERGWSSVKETEMDSSLTLLKNRARDLHRKAAKGDVAVLEQVARLPEFRAEPLGDLAERLQRKHCLAVVARSLGFSNWPALVHFLDGSQHGQFGTVLYPRGAWAYTNIWCAGYQEAKDIQAEGGGFLLGYKQHYFVAQGDFIDMLGLHSDDPDWQLAGRDWIRPSDLSARNRLFHNLLQ